VEGAALAILLKPVSTPVSKPNCPMPCGPINPCLSALRVSIMTGAIRVSRRYHKQHALMGCLNRDLIMGPIQSTRRLRQNSINVSVSDRRRFRSGLRARISAQGNKRPMCVLKDWKVDWVPAYEFIQSFTTAY
jgi:hypothetical protein